MNIAVNLKKKVVMFLTAVLTVACVFSFSAVSAHADVGTANTDGVNVRSAAVDGELVGALSSGDQVVINEETTGSDGNTWYNITFDHNGSEVTGYVRGDFLDVVTDTDTEETDVESDETETEEDEAENTTDDYAPVAADSEYVVASSIPEELYPDGFSVTTVDYEGSQIAALKADTAEVYLIYVERADDPDDGKLVVYDMTRSELLPFIQFKTANGYIVLLNIPSEELLRVSDRFVQTTCSFTSGTMDALQLSQADDIVAGDISVLDFYYMYGVDQDGNYGWYLYNAVDGTIQKNTINMQYSLDGTSTEVEETDNGAFSITDIPMLILIVAAAVFALLLILVIVFAVRYHRLVELIDEDEEEDDEDEDEDAIDDISVGRVRTTRPGNAFKGDVAPEPTAADDTLSQTQAMPVTESISQETPSGGSDTIDMYNSFSEALERMAAQESGVADTGEPVSAATEKPVSPAAEKQAETLQTAPEAPAADASGDDEDDDLEFL